MRPDEEGFGMMPALSLAGIPDNAWVGGEGSGQSRLPWQDLDFFKMAEVRQNVDASQSFYPSGGSAQPRFSSMVKVSLAEAVSKVVSGELEPGKLIAQLPEQVRTLLGSLADASYQKKLDELTPEQQRQMLVFLSVALAEAEKKMPASAPQRPEMRMDSSRSYYPPAGSKTHDGERAGLRLLVAVSIAGVAIGLAVFLWRWSH